MYTSKIGLQDIFGHISNAKFQINSQFIYSHKQQNMLFVQIKLINVSDGNGSNILIWVLSLTEQIHEAITQDFHRPIFNYDISDTLSIL